MKRLMRYMPRRSNLHRYPGLKYFAKWLKQQDFFWSFRTNEVVPALYAGWIITMLPIQGIQVASALFLAWALRANVMILVGLQAVSNLVTGGPIYIANAWVAQRFYNLIGIEGVSFASADPQSTSKLHQYAMSFAEWGVDVFVGGAILGYIAALISVTVYRLSIPKKTN